MAPDRSLGDRMRNMRWPVKSTLTIWALLTIVLFIFSFSVRFDSDVKKLDGSDAAVFRAEQDFHRVWGGKSNQAILVVTGPDLEKAMEANDAVYRKAVKVIGKEEITSLALFWPSERIRKENRDRWDRFWKEGRENRLRGLIRERSAAYGFSDQAFAPFFNGLYGRGNDAVHPGGLITQLQERFVVHKDGEYRIMSFFPDEPRYLEALRQVMQQHPGAFIVSGKELSASISNFTIREMNFLAPLAVLFNLVLVWLFFRNWKETLIAMVPLLTGVVWLTGFMAIVDMPLNVVNIIACVIVSGVIVDYGVGITYEYRRNLHFGAVMAMTLSAASNVIGAGALLFARHPALYSTGIVMVISMVAGYLSSILVVPSFCSIMASPKQDEVRT
jgi:predicted RND superfamily exporter protein